MATFTELTEMLAAHADVKAQIAELRARNQNAPKYLHEQAQTLLTNAVDIAAELDRRLENFL